MELSINSYGIVDDIFSAKKQIDAQKNRPLMGGKVLTLNTEYVLLFPMENGKLTVAGMPSRTCSFDKLGISECRLETKEFEIDTNSGRLKDASILRNWARVSQFLYKAEQVKDLEHAINEEKNKCEKTGEEVNPTIIKQITEGIDIEFNGAPKVDGKDAILPKKQRLLGPIQTTMFTEAVLIPLNEDLEPAYDRAVGVGVKLSKTKISDLVNIMKHKVYSQVEDPNGFLEVKFNYQGDNAQTAGKNAYSGVEPKNRKVDLTKLEDGTYKDKSVKEIAHILNGTAHSRDIIHSRSSIVAMAKTTKEVEAALRKYILANAALLPYIDMADDDFQSASPVFRDLNIFNVNTKQYKELLEIIQTTEGDGDEGDLAPGSLQKLADAASINEVGEIPEEEVKELMSETDVDEL